MIILDRLLIGGLRFVFDKITAAVDAELTDDTALREELLAAQMQLELGELTEEEYGDLERALLQRIDEVRGRARGPADRSGRVAVASIETVPFGEDERRS